MLQSSSGEWTHLQTEEELEERRRSIEAVFRADPHPDPKVAEVEGLCLYSAGVASEGSRSLARSRHAGRSRKRASRNARCRELPDGYGPEADVASAIDAARLGEFLEALERLLAGRNRLWQDASLIVRAECGDERLDTPVPRVTDLAAQHGVSKGRVSQIVGELRAFAARF